MKILLILVGIFVVITLLAKVDVETWMSIGVVAGAIAIFFFAAYLLRIFFLILFGRNIFKKNLD